jgi:hypothetical protein
MFGCCRFLKLRTVAQERQIAITGLHMGYGSAAIADYGIYQIYGTHDLSGSDTLFYVGQADSGTFGFRIMAHQSDWGRWDPRAGR